MLSMIKKAQIIAYTTVTNTQGKDPKSIFHNPSPALEGTFRDPIPHPCIGLNLSDRLHVRHRRTDLPYLDGTKVGHPPRLRGTNAEAPDGLVSPGQRAEELEQLDGRLYSYRASSARQRRSVYAAVESTYDLGQIVFRRVLRLALQQRKPITEWNDREDVVPEEPLPLDHRTSHETDDLGPRPTARVENVECGRWRLSGKRRLQNARGLFFLA